MNLLPFGVALGITLGAIPLIRPLAARFGFVDHPTGRKVHVTPIPLGGGLGLVLGLGLGTLVGILQSDVPFARRPVLAWLAGLVLVVLVGLKDDRSPMSPLPKLAGQIVAALVLVLGTGIPAPGALSGLAVPLAVVAAVALMNACNFLDNMDGILGGIAVVCGLACAILAPLGSAAAHGAAALAGAALGFLAYNFAPARIFMGDAGSLAVGYTLAALALALAPGSLAGGPEVGLLIGLGLVLGYPVFDLTFVTVTRLSDGRRPWTPGKDHTTHRLQRVLGNPRRTAFVVYSLTLVSAAIGVAASRLPMAQSLVLAGGSLLLFLGLGVRLARIPSA